MCVFIIFFFRCSLQTLNAALWLAHTVWEQCQLHLRNGRCASRFPCNHIPHGNSQHEVNQNRYRSNFHFNKLPYSYDYYPMQEMLKHELSKEPYADLLQSYIDGNFKIALDWMENEQILG